MSRRPTMLKKQSEHKFFCKLCLDNGQPMAIVTSHNVVGGNGKSCCPTKANLLCSKCNRKGHSANYCSTSSNMFQRVEKLLDKCSAGLREPEKTASFLSLSNPFGELDVSSDEQSPRTPLKKKVVDDMDCPWAPRKVIRKKPLCWADLSDSDDE